MYNAPHRVTEIRSVVCTGIENDGISHHVTHVRLEPGSRGQVADPTFTSAVGLGED